MNETKSSNLKWVLVISVLVNFLLVGYVAMQLIIGWYIDKSGSVDLAAYNALKTRMCEERYDQIMRDIETKTEPDLVDETKNSFAINVCHRNYKTGKDLNLKPLIDQVK